MSSASTTGPPTGLLAFLFTDVQGSTRLWAADADRMSASLVVHDRIVRAAIESNGGYVFTTAGDSYAAAFARASGAVDAAVQTQRELAAATWPGPPLAVRIGIHVGEAEERDGDYFGPVVNLAARVEAAGHGGQTLITAPVRQAAEPECTSLGVHRLRDVETPIELFQVGDGDFPPLRTELNPVVIPAARNPLLGRADVVDEVLGLLPQHRLVTLTGPGGMGKTRCAVEIATRFADFTGAAAYFVELASVGDPESIEPTIARTLGVVFTGDRDSERLRARLSSTPTLLVIDNCEHLIDDVALLIDELLATCPTVTVLATSREELDVDGEYSIRLRPLSLDDDGAAVDLFVERASAVDSTFQADEAVRASISALCTRLDGLPLAIELAAGRTRMLSVEEISQRLDHRLELLTGGRRSRMRRHQTLRSTIEWSTELLTPAERAALAQLAVFTGSFDLEGAAAVTGIQDAAVTDVVQSLVMKSLVESVAASATHRFRLLESIREWGLEQLERDAMLDETRQRHAQRFIDALEHCPLSTWDGELISREWADDLDDALAAIVYLRDRSPLAAAMIAGPLGHALVDRSRGRVCFEVLNEAELIAPPELASRVWFGRALVGMFLQAVSSPAALPPPGGLDYEEALGFGTGAGMGGFALAWIAPEQSLELLTSLEAAIAVGDGDKRLLGMSTANASHAAVILGRWSASVRYTRRCLSELPAGSFFGQMAAWSGAVAARLSGDDAMLDDLRAWSAGQFAMFGTRNSALTERYVWPRSLSPHDQGRWVAAEAQRWVTDNYPGQEAPFVALFAYLALERGERDRAQYLVDSFVSRSPADTTLARFVVHRLQGDDPDQTENVADHHRLWSSFDPNTHPERREACRSALRDELARWAD